MQINQVSRFYMSSQPEKHLFNENSLNNFHHRRTQLVVTIFINMHVSNNTIFCKKILIPFESNFIPHLRKKRNFAPFFDRDDRNWESLRIYHSNFLLSKKEKQAKLFPSVGFISKLLALRKKWREEVFLFSVNYCFSRK